MLFRCLMILILLPVCISCESKQERAGMRPVEVLAEDIFAPDEATRISAFQELARYEDDALPALPALLEALSHDDEKAQRTAALIIGKIGKPAVPALEKIIEKSVDMTEVANASLAAGEIGIDALELAPLLSGNLGRVDEELRVQSAIALGKIRADWNPGGFQTSFSIQNQEVADLAKMVVGGRGEAEAGALSAGVKKVEALPGPTRQRFGNIENLVGHLPDEDDDSVEFQLGWGVDDEDPGVQIIPALLKALREDQSAKVRAAAARALAISGDTSGNVINALADQLYSWNSEDEVIIAAAKALGKIGKPAASAVSELSRARRNTNNPLVRQAAAEAIEQITK